MNLTLSENHAMLRQTVRAFVSSHVAQQAAEWDHARALPEATLRALGDLGMLGVLVDESRGGAGMDTLACAVAVEELAAGDGSLALVVATHNVQCAATIQALGGAGAHADTLKALAEGRALGTWALYEHGSGQAPLAGTLTAERTTTGWRLSGTKANVVYGHRADVIVAFAATAEGGANAFVLRSGQLGLSAQMQTSALGMRAAPRATLTLDDVQVSDDARLGPVDGALGLGIVLDRARIVRAALSVGLARAALDAASHYALERKQFGQAIGNFQGVQWHIADSATELDAARLLTWRAAAAVDRGASATTDAAMAKAYAADAAMRICDRAIQVHGGYGYTREYLVERFWRDAKHCQLSEGTSEAQRLTVGRRVVEAHAQ